MAYRARPYVCGAIGRWDEHVPGRLPAADQDGSRLADVAPPS